MRSIIFSCCFILIAAILSSCNTAEQNEPGVYVIPEEIKSLPEGTTLGLRAPEIELPDLEGVKRSLSDLHGKLVLVDFWAAWCNPCRRENPELARVFDKYKNKSFTKGEGFEIVSVSLDRNEEAWREAVRQDGINWSYVLGDMLGARTQSAIDYGVQMIPANFLLDRNGVVIASNLRGEALEEKLKELLEEE